MGYTARVQTVRETRHFSKAAARVACGHDFADRTESRNDRVSEAVEKENVILSEAKDLTLETHSVYDGEVGV